MLYFCQFANEITSLKITTEINVMRLLYVDLMGMVKNKWQHCSFEIVMMITDLYSSSLVFRGQPSGLSSTY